MMMMIMMISASAMFLLLLSRLVCNGSLRSHKPIWGSGGIASSTGRFTLCENCPSTLRIGCQVNRRPSWRCGGTQTVFVPSRWLTISLLIWLSQRVIIRIPSSRTLLNIGSWCHKVIRQLHCLRIPGWSLAPLRARLATYCRFEIAPSSHLFLCTSLFHLSSSLSARLSTWWTYRSELQTMKGKRT
jgi:hypothetical protein